MLLIRHVAYTWLCRSLLYNIMIEQNRTEQNRTEQSRTEQNRGEQNILFHENYSFLWYYHDINIQINIQIS